VDIEDIGAFRAKEHKVINRV